MSSTPMLLEFAAETCLFVAAVEGVVLALQADLLGIDREGRLGLGLGFGLLGVGSVVAGTLLIVHPARIYVLLLVIRLAAVITLAIGAVRVEGHAAIRRSLLAGGLLVGAAAVAAERGSTTGADVAILVGAVAMGVAVQVAAERSIAIRLATTVSLVVLCSVLLASGSVYAVINHHVQSGLVIQDRRDIMRLLFLVSLGATVASVVAATVVGDRIGGGLRRLNDAADRLRDGDLWAPATTGSANWADELGTLGRSFDRMAESLRDMTGDLHVAAEREASLRGRLEAVIAGMAEGLVVSDAEGLVTECNRAAEALLGVTSAEVVGRRLDDALWFTPTGAEGPVSLVVPADGVLTMEGSVDGPSGEAVPVVIRAGALPDPEGTASGSVLVIRDVRGEQEAERMKADFLANISHELRTPLTPIKGYAGVLERRPVDHAQAAIFAREIAAGVDQVERVIGQLVNFATVASGVLAVHPVRVTAGEVIQAVAERWQLRLGPDWTVDVQVLDGSTSIEVDRAYLDQAFDELVDNAVKYSPGSQRVTIGCALRPPDEGRRPRLRLAVADRGVGIDPDRLEELTDAFAQGERSSTRRFGGLGLGLALVQRIVRAHGGLLTCESVLGRGSRFSILLPVDDPIDADWVNLAVPE